MRAWHIVLVTMATEALKPEAEAALLEGLKRLDGSGTLADVVRATGLPREATEQSLRTMLGLYQSHLEVDENGELLYLFDPALKRREKDGGQLWRTLWGWSRQAFTVLFKVSVMGILVFYVLTFCVLIVAAFAALLSMGEGLDLDVFDADGQGCLSFMGELFFFWDAGEVLFIPYILATDDGKSASRGGRASRDAFSEPHALEPRYVTDTYEARRSRGHHFYEDVFAFVFGPTVPDPPGLAAERELVAWIHAHNGVITLTELISRTGLSVEEAEQEMTRILVRYEGDPQVTEGGQILYTFHDLKVTAQEEDRFATRPAPPVWHRFEPDPQLNGVSTGRNVLIGSMAAFTLLMSIAVGVVLSFTGAGLVLAPFLSVVPLLVSLGFFLIPTGRQLLEVSPQKKRARRRNLRRALQLVVFEHILHSRDQRLTRQSVVAHARAVMASLQQAPGTKEEGRRTMEGLETLPESAFHDVLEEVIVELNAECEGDELSFPEQCAELDAAERARREAGPSQVGLGEIVFSSADEDDDPLRDTIDGLGEPPGGATIPGEDEPVVEEVQAEEAEVEEVEVETSR